MARRLFSFPLALASGLALAAVGGAGCSLAIHDAEDQCSADADCARFDGAAVCRAGVCVASGLGPPGCFAGEPASDAQFRRRCTDAQCVAFDNCGRLGLCGAAPALPALTPPAPPP